MRSLILIAMLIFNFSLGAKEYKRLSLKKLSPFQIEHDQYSDLNNNVGVIISNLEASKIDKRFGRSPASANIDDQMHDDPVNIAGEPAKLKSW